MTVKMSIGTDLLEIEKIQEEYDIAFPVDYIYFLNNYNGMFVGDGGYCTMPFSKVDDSEIEFQELYGINSINKNFDLYNANKVRDEVIALASPFVIGSDPGGNLFLIDGDNGPVYYWDRTHMHFDSNPDFPEKEEEGDIYKFSDSFTDFYECIVSHLGGNKDIVEVHL